MRLFLNVPYSEKDEAKALGAKWNPKEKKWYINVPQEEYVKFSKWILRKSEDVIIATENLYIVEGARACWRCGKETKVVGLGISCLNCVHCRYAVMGTVNVGRVIYAAARFVGNGYHVTSIQACRS